MASAVMLENMCGVMISITNCYIMVWLRSIPFLTFGLTIELVVILKFLNLTAMLIAGLTHLLVVG